MVTYYTLDNGGLPFRVDIQQHEVTIYVADWVTEDMKEQVDRNHSVRDEYDEQYFFFRRLVSPEIHVGTSPLNCMTEYSGGHGQQFDGNSLLLRIGDFTYLHIGACIFTFRAHGKITSYVSPVGNSDVPYPYAVDEHNNIYLMLHCMVMRNTTNVEDPYDVYYDLLRGGSNEKHVVLTPFQSKRNILKRD